jgi:2',3'-cyclic-nucleotide 2'-phosphodiesterase (5'-nucleotidase family)
MIKKPGVGQLLAFLLFFASCKTSFLPQKVEYLDYQITAALPKDSSLLNMMRPYGDSVNNSMNMVVAIADQTLEKKLPSGSLNNFMADAMLFSAKQKFGVPVDAAFVNYGGIRTNQLAKGEVTRGKVFELMPFDNILLLQKIKGDVLQQFLDHTASLGGWPVAGITMQIADKKAVNVSINGKPLDVNKIYTIANSDYVANGGDNAAMLKPIPQQNIGYLMRDAIFDYIKALKAEGKNITAQTENRITNAQ